MHSYAADVGHEITLGYEEGAGSPGWYEGQSLWKAEDRTKSITLRELKAVRLFL